MLFIDPNLIFTLKTYASLFIVWALPSVFCGLALLGKDPIRGQTSWDLLLDEVKSTRRSPAVIRTVAGTDSRFSLKPAQKKPTITNADGYIPLNQSLLKSVVNQQKKRRINDHKYNIIN